MDPNSRLSIGTFQDQDTRAVGIACRLDSPEAIDVVQALTDYLLARKEKIFFETRISGKFIRHFAKNLSDMTIKNTKFLISVGGDGTVLRVCQGLPKNDVPPLLGVNMGSVGFLDESDKETLFRDLDKIFNGEYYFERCVRLTTVIGSHILPDALNEVLIISSKPSKVLYVSIDVDGGYFTSSYLDGLIISSHTGSTAYALSAGGCLMDPRLEAFEVVPLNPFAGTGALRPLLVPDTSNISVKLQRPRLNGRVIIDGQVEYKVAPQIKITVRKSNSDIHFIRFNPDIQSGYFDRVRNKILFSRKLADDSVES